jgi:DNA ligase-1
MIEPKILYSRTAKDAVNTWYCYAEGPEVVTVWGQLNGAQQTTRFTCVPKNEGKKNATTAEQQAVKEVAALYKAQLRKKYSESIEENDADESISPMLAKKWEDHKDKLDYSKGVFIQPKLDGLRAIAVLKDGKVVLQSRGNKTYCIPHIEAALEYILKKNPGIVLDGELYRHGVSLQTINSWVRGKKVEVRDIEYHIYDMVSEHDFAKRTSDLEKLAEDICVSGVPNPALVLVETQPCESEEQAVALQAYFVSKGYEGAMVRVGTSKYKTGHRSADLLKIKSWVTEEFPIVGHKVGKGKFESVPMIVCSLPNGGTVDVTPTGTMEQRKELLANIQSYIGMPYTVKYFGLSPYGVPLYPTGVGVRFPEDMS